MCQRSKVPGRKFSQTTSETEASLRKMACPSGVRRSRVTLRRLGLRPTRTASTLCVLVLAVFDERSERSHHVAGARLLDLDHVGSHLAEEACAEGGRQSRTRSRTRMPSRDRSSSALPGQAEHPPAMMLRCTSLVPPMMVAACSRATNAAICRRRGCRRRRSRVGSRLRVLASPCAGSAGHLAQ
jgi:hypothetical protein